MTSVKRSKVCYLREKCHEVKIIKSSRGDLGSERLIPHWVDRKVTKSQGQGIS